MTDPTPTDVLTRELHAERLRALNLPEATIDAEWEAITADPHRLADVRADAKLRSAAEAVLSAVDDAELTSAMDRLQRAVDMRPQSTYAYATPAN